MRERERERERERGGEGGGEGGSQKTVETNQHKKIIDFKKRDNGKLLPYSLNSTLIA